MQTLSTACSKMEPKIFTPPQTSFPGAQDGQNLISWRWSLPSPRDPVWWRSMHAISNYHGDRPTPQTNTHKQTRPITIHCAAKLSVQSNNDIYKAQFSPRQQMCCQQPDLNKSILTLPCKGVQQIVRCPQVDWQTVPHNWTVDGKAPISKVCLGAWNM